jgi:hypothetical protein
MFTLSLEGLRPSPATNARSRASCSGRFLKRAPLADVGAGLQFTPLAPILEGGYEGSGTLGTIAPKTQSAKP